MRVQPVSTPAPVSFGVDPPGTCTDREVPRRVVDGPPCPFTGERAIEETETREG
jgi:hypothetical protein